MLIETHHIARLNFVRFVSFRLWVSIFYYSGWYDGKDRGEGVTPSPKLSVLLECMSVEWTRVIVNCDFFPCNRVFIVEETNQKKKYK